MGKDVREDKAPFGRPLYLDIYSVDVTLGYGVTDRFAVNMTAPFSHGTHSRYYADGNRHEVSASGVGDITVGGTYWLFRTSGPSAGNVAVGAGIKTPSGDHSAEDNYFLPDSVTHFTVDQSIQPGDGGWGVVVNARGFRRLLSGYAYASGSYLMSPRNQTEVIQGQSGPYSAVRVSVPDVYQVRAGMAHTISRRGSLAGTVGVRVDGIPLRDLIGGSDGFRRPVVLGYVDAGLSVGRGRNVVSINVPIRVYEDFRRSLIDVHLGTDGGGDLAKYLIFADIKHRF